MRRRMFETSLISLMIISLIGCADNSLTSESDESEIQNPSLAAPIRMEHPPLKFVDNFERDKGWGIFEEIVGGNPCYGAGIGEVARSTDVAFNGSHSLRVWANKAGSIKSNHVIGQKKLADFGQTGRWRYQLYAYIDPETGGEGQTGPEFSVQNTRQIAPGEYRTATAGIQYRASPFKQLGRWAVWREEAPGQASWHVFTPQPPLLTPGKWYYISIEADYINNRYGQFRLRGDGVNVSVNLSAYKIALEPKFNEEAFWLTLEGENLWNNCGEAGIFDYKVYYDHVMLQPQGLSEDNSDNSDN